MRSNPLLSIVIPTRNRPFYVEKLVRGLLENESDEIEVVVHDNSDVAAWGTEFSDLIKDGRLRYVCDTTSMSMAENFERAVAVAKGTYVCMLGDDDGVTGLIVDLARWMAERGIEAAISKYPVYLWPGVRSALEGDQSCGVLRLPWYSGRIELIEAGSALIEALESGGTEMGTLPGVYCSVVSRDALERLKTLAGEYFPGPSPDMANAVALTGVIRQYAKVDMPIVIAGASPGSGAARGARREHEGEIENEKFLPKGTAADWPASVPRYFSGPTIWATTLMVALRKTGREALLEKFRFDRLYAACIVFNPRYRPRVHAARHENPGLVNLWALAIAIGWVWRRRVRSLAGNLRGKVASRVFRGRAPREGFQDIQVVMRFLTQHFAGLCSAFTAGDMEGHGSGMGLGWRARVKGAGKKSR